MVSVVNKCCMANFVSEVAVAIRSPRCLHSIEPRSGSSITHGMHLDGQPQVVKFCDDFSEFVGRDGQQLIRVVR